MLPYWIILVLIVSKVLGGKFKNFADVNYKGGKWVALAFALQLVSVFILRRDYTILSNVFLIVGFALLLYVAWLNIRLPGMPVILAGIFLNFLVITANGGVMPITYETLEQTNRTYKLIPASEENLHVTQTVMFGKTGVLTDPKLLFLGDVIIVTVPGLGTSIMSIGDLLVAIGVAWFCFGVMSVPLFRRLRFT
jgi:Family of unknown function (DUF5317)